MIAGPSDGRPRAGVLQGSISAFDAIGEAEASAFAARFATDFLSWDEESPAQRAAVLRTYLADPRAATLGWSGEGRQRADAPLPGRTLRTSDDTIVVEVTVRITPYQRTHPRRATPDPLYPGTPPLDAVGPSSAPPPADDGWRAGAAYWKQLAPPVTRDRTGRLVIDIGPAPDPDDS